jgi:hypothetical protein
MPAVETLTDIHKPKIKPMVSKELKEMKEELMKPDWTENLQHALEELEPEDARKIVESMSRAEIYSKVNNRQFQEDYIADYLEYLWEISEPAYWKHIIISLNVKVGTLWSDNMAHFEKMCTKKIPDDVFKAVLSFAINYNGTFKEDLDAIGCVLKAQIDKFGRIKEIKQYILSLKEEKQDLANSKIHELAKRDCNYLFY